MADGVNKMSSRAQRRAAALLALVAAAVMLGACSKCDVPTWQHGDLGGAPAACHDEPAPQ